MSELYILDEKGRPKPEPDAAKWGQWFETANRSVARDKIGDVVISTVFLGLNHAFVGGPPILWETMVFGGPMDQEDDRCSGSREQAETMHNEMVERVRVLFFNHTTI